MHYNYNDLKKISINSDKNYYIKRHAYYNSLKDALIDGQKIYQRMRYLVQTHEEYIDISFIVAISQTNGKTAIKTKEKTKGRPKYKIIGKRVKPHIHIACYGKNAPTFVKEITNRLNKNIYKSYKDYCKRDYKSNRLFSYDKFKDEYNGVYYVPYIFKQADRFYSYGKIDFNNMKDDFFIAFNKNDFNEKINSTIEKI